MVKASHPARALDFDGPDGGPRSLGETIDPRSLPCDATAPAGTYAPVVLRPRALDVTAAMGESGLARLGHCVDAAMMGVTIRGVQEGTSVHARARASGSELDPAAGEAKAHAPAPAPT